MFRRKMTEQELRMWCIERSSTKDAHIFWEQAEILYKYITSGESKEVQKKPRECFLSRLCSKILRLPK